MKLLFKISDTIDRICGWAIVSLFSIMIISFALQVILRYFIGTGFKWTEELTRYANVWAVMIGFAMIAKRRNHINISVLEEILKRQEQEMAYYCTATDFACHIHNHVYHIIQIDQTCR